MPAPVSPITDLWNRLRATTALNGIPLLLGAKKMAAGRSPPSIVMFPVAGALSAAANKSVDWIDVDLPFVAHCWGADSGSDGDGFNSTWALKEAFIQALYEQGPADGSGSNLGYYFKMVEERWDTSFDSAKQGEAVEVFFVPHLVAASKEVQGIGTVGQVLLASSSGAPPPILITP